MDAELIILFERLSEDMANLAKAMALAQDTLDKLLHEVRKNGKTQKETAAVTKRFLASQQPRWSRVPDSARAYPPLENDDYD